MFHLRLVSVAVVIFSPALPPWALTNHLGLLTCIVAMGLPSPVHPATLNYLPLGSWDTSAQSVFDDSHIACNIYDFWAWHSRLPILGSQEDSATSCTNMPTCSQFQYLSLLGIALEHSAVCVFIHVALGHPLSPFHPLPTPSFIKTS